MKPSFTLIARAVMTALIVGASAQATILTEFSNVGAWTSATTGVVTQTFTGEANAYNTTNAGLTRAGLNYRGFYNENVIPLYDTYLYTPPASESMGTGVQIIGGTNGWLGNGTYNAGIEVNLGGTPNVTSFGFDFSAFRVRTSQQGDQYVYSKLATPIVLTLQVYEGGTLTGTRNLTVANSSGSAPVATYYGFQTSGSISSIKLYIDTPTNTIINRVILDNIAYGQIAAQSEGGQIPEPQTFLLCGGALVLATLVRRARA
jgi:hypothetical protein